MTDAPRITEVWPDGYLNIVDWKARCYVNGTRLHGETKKQEPAAGEWSVRFRGHPWVEAAEREGWGLDLRTAIIAEVKRRILHKEDYGNIEDLMPPKKRADEWRAVAERNRAACEWRNKIIAEHGSLDAFLTRGRGGRSGFQKLNTSRLVFEARHPKPEEPKSDDDKENAA